MVRGRIATCPCKRCLSHLFLEHKEPQRGVVEGVAAQVAQAQAKVPDPVAREEAHLVREDDVRPRALELGEHGREDKNVDDFHRQREKGREGRRPVRKRKRGQGR